MILGNFFSAVFCFTGVFSMGIDDFSPYRIWFTLPGLFLVTIVVGIFGDWIQPKITDRIKGKNEHHLRTSS